MLFRSKKGDRSGDSKISLMVINDQINFSIFSQHNFENQIPLMPVRAITLLLIFAAFFSCNNSEKGKQEPMLPTPSKEVSSGIQKIKKDTLKGLIQITRPQSGQIIHSPLHLEGVARGYWFFEANFRIELLDENSRQITETYASAKGEWMIEEWVPFESTLTFSKPTSRHGVLIFHKANPSGLAEHQMSDTLKIRFQ